MARTVGLTFEDKPEVSQEVVTTNTEIEEVSTADEKEKPKKQKKNPKSR